MTLGGTSWGMTAAAIQSMRQLAEAEFVGIDGFNVTEVHLFQQNLSESDSWLPVEEFPLEIPKEA